MNIIIRKWIEPYVLLESIKKSYKMKDFTFDGSSKNEQFDNFLLEIGKDYNFGIYMKNVNKFYLFYSDNKIDFMELLGLSNKDIEFTEDIEKSLNMVDLAKAEAVIIKLF